MTNLVVKNLINTGFLEGKRIFTTNVRYERFLRPRKSEDGLKPDGLWYSVGDSWLNWCVGEDYGGIGKYIYEIELRPKADILFLNSKKDVVSFSKEYVREDRLFLPFTSIYIDWDKVKNNYDGIEVNPYFGELRHHHGLIWYYGWDVPSGCIWKAGAKKRITLIAEYKPRKKEFMIL